MPQYIDRNIELSNEKNDKILETIKCLFYFDMLRKGVHFFP